MLTLRSLSESEPTARRTLSATCSSTVEKWLCSSQNTTHTKDVAPHSIVIMAFQTSEEPPYPRGYSPIFSTEPDSRLLAKAGKAEGGVVGSDELRGLLIVSECVGGLKVAQDILR